MVARTDTIDEWLELFCACGENSELKKALFNTFYFKGIVLKSSSANNFVKFIHEVYSLDPSFSIGYFPD